MNTSAPPTFVASAAIARRRFVKISGDFLVNQCVANEIAIGISGEGSAEAPIPGASGNAAAADGQLRVYGQNEVTIIEVGSAVTAGQYVKPDANGRAVPCAATNQYSAQVLRGQSVANGVAEVLICRGVAP